MFYVLERQKTVAKTQNVGGICFHIIWWGLQIRLQSLSPDYKPMSRNQMADTRISPRTRGCVTRIYCFCLAEADRERTSTERPRKGGESRTSSWGGSLDSGGRAGAVGLGVRARGKVQSCLYIRWCAPCARTRRFAMESPCWWAQAGRTRGAGFRKGRGVRSAGPGGPDPGGRGRGAAAWVGKGRGRGGEGAGGRWQS